METAKLREKLKAQFSEIIEDDNNLNYLQEAFEEIYSKEYVSQVPEWHWKEVEERRRRHLAGETTSEDWDIVRERLKKKYGF